MGLKIFGLTMKFENSTGKVHINSTDLVNQTGVLFVLNFEDISIDFDINGEGTWQSPQNGMFCNIHIKDDTLITGDDQRLGFVC